MTMGVSTGGAELHIDLGAIADNWRTLQKPSLSGKGLGEGQDAGPRVEDPHLSPFPRGEGAVGAVLKADA